MNQILCRISMAGMLCCVFSSVSEGARIVTANERGLYYALPAQCGGNYNCTDWSGIGAYVGQFSYQNLFNAMDTATLKMGHGRFQHFASFDDNTEALFPYSQFVKYDAAEVAAGRTSLFVSATYQNKTRPVVWNWYGNTSLSLGHAVNLKDDRFIQFWVNQYIHPWLTKINKPNTYVLLDNSTFSYARYGVQDNAGNFVSGVTWNHPYAQNQAEFLDSINKFFIRVHQLDPKIKMIGNTDGAEPPGEFVTSFQNADGISIENMEYYYQGNDDWWRGAFYNQYVNAAWAGNAGKVGLMIWAVPTSGTSAALRRDYVHYLIVRGDNFFFAPRFGSNEVPPSAYASMKTSLGLPTGSTSVVQESGRPQGYVLYSRQTANGIVYLNWSGTTKTIKLPAGHQYIDSSGHATTQITIKDQDGDYVLFSGSSSASTGTVYLGDVAPTSEVNGWGPVEMNISNGETGSGDGHPLSIRGVKYPNGVGAHAPSSLGYDLASIGSCSSFIADVGVDDGTGGRGSVIFEVWADGSMLWSSGVMVGTTPARNVNVPITGARQLTLSVLDAGDGNGDDHADWAGARLTCQ